MAVLSFGEMFVGRSMFLGIDFRVRMPTGVNLAGPPNVTATPMDNAASPTDLVLANVGIQGDAVIALASGGTGNVSYEIAFTCTDTSGEMLEERAVLYIQE
jgi:hypothetical protein